MARLFEQARETVYNRLLQLSEAELDRLKALTIGGRIKWVLDFLERNYPGSYTITKVARRSGVITPQGLWAIIRDETKNPSARVVAALADELGVPMRFLLIGDVPARAPGAAWLASLPPHLREFVSAQESVPYLRAACEVAHAARVQDLPPEVLHQLVEIWMTISQRVGENSAKHRSVAATDGTRKR